MRTIESWLAVEPLAQINKEQWLRDVIEDYTSDKVKAKTMKLTKQQEIQQLGQMLTATTTKDKSRLKAIAKRLTTYANSRT